MFDFLKKKETWKATFKTLGSAYSYAKIGDTIILPLVDVTFGVGAGAGRKEKQDSAGGGMTGKMTPSAVLVIKNGQTKLVNVKNQDTVTKILDMIPDILDRFTTKKEDMPADDEAIDIAFPEEKE